MNQILKDAKIISEYLGIKCPELEFSPDSVEGITLGTCTIIGTKGDEKYTRRLLIHELLHTAGLGHTYPSNFMSAVVTDFGLVDFILLQCFEVQFQKTKEDEGKVK